MKKAIAVMAALFICRTSVSAEVRVPDVFGNTYVEFDINADGTFDIRDLVRLEKAQRRHTRNSKLEFCKQRKRRSRAFGFNA